MRIPYTLSSESITVFAGGKMHTVLSGHKNFDLLREHLKLPEHSVETILRLVDREETIRNSTVGHKVTVESGVVYYDGEEVHGTLTSKLLKMLDEGFDATPWVKFLEKLMDNPSYRSRNCLFDFLEKFNAPITPEGNFIAFKRVRSDFKDIHSGTMDNSVGNVLKMDRAKVDDDPQHTCSAGLHVCADEYLNGYANADSTKTLVVEVSPADVVAVPYDYNFAKMRVCEYKVAAEIDPKTIPEILDNEMYGDYYPDSDEEDEADVDTDLCDDPDCWCVN